MKRFAILMGSDGANDSDDKLEMISIDLELMRRHLFSVNGGAWEHHEIGQYHNRNIDFLKNKIKFLKEKKLDFLFFYWSGHGGHCSIKETTAMELSDSKIIYESDFYGIAEKQLMIFDTCRNLSTLVESSENLKFNMIGTEKLVNLEQRKKAKSFYNSIIKYSVTGRQIFYSSEKNEASQAETDGSVYTKCILQSSKQWLSTAQPDTYISMKKISEISKDCCSEQNPTFRIPKSTKLFPFTIKVSP